MKIPERLAALEAIGAIDGVVRPLMSGKEAAVYLVETRGELRVAKVYKEASRRSFQHRAEYTEGRKVRNSRQQRAIDKKSKYGREEIESAWRSAEVDAIWKLRAAGVRVPEPYDFVEGVLVMELIRGWDGGPAPRLVDVDFTPDEARDLHRILVREVCKMLCAGVIHGDLSDFNVLITPEGPVIIDFPQWVDPSGNLSARKLFVRDMDNVTSFLARFLPSLADTRFGPEMWSLYEKGTLLPDSPLTGRWRGSERQANVSRVVDEIQAAERDHRRRMGEDVEAEEEVEARPAPRKRARRQSETEAFFEGLDWRGAGDATKGPAVRAARAPVEPPRPQARPPERDRGPQRPSPPRPQAPPKPQAQAQAQGQQPPRDGGGEGPPKRRRRRRRSGGGGGGGGRPPQG